MYSGDEFYGDDITSGLSERDRIEQMEARRRRLAMENRYPTIPGPRAVGTVTCKGCGATVQVRYAYSNSNRVICLIDHTEGRTDKRCRNAGRTLIEDGKWLRGAGYTPEEVQWSQTIEFERLKEQHE